jgi:hypothetical protein
MGADPRKPAAGGVRNRETPQTPEDVTEAMDLVCRDVGPAEDGFASAAARRVLERTEW